MGSDLKRCPFCAEEIQAQAVKCKHCAMMLNQSPPMMPPLRPPHGLIMKLVRGALMGTTVVMVLGMVAICAGSRRHQTPIVTSARTSPPTGEPAQTVAVEEEVTAEELAQAYSANEIAADNRFRGKWLRVRGRVDGIEKDLFDESKLKLRAKASLLGISCGFEDGWEEQLARVQKNDQVTIRCLGKGTLVIPHLESCALEAIQR